VGKWEKLLARVLSGKSDANIRFDALCGLLEHLGLERRTGGKHRVIFGREDIPEPLNLQPVDRGHEAKPYQVKQVRSYLKRYKIGV